MKTVFDIVSRPDTVIILKNPLTAFAAWNQVEVVFNENDQEPDAPSEPSDVPSVVVAVDDGPVAYEPAVDAFAYQSAVEEPAVEEPAVEEPAVEEPAVQELGEIEYSAPSASAAPVVDTAAEEIPAKSSESESFIDEEEIHYHVSAQHLSLASARFKSMLFGGNWKEGVPEIDGLYYISAEDWDTEALLILLNVLHHRNRQVPRSVSLEMLAKITVLIDYYDCAEAVELCTERWVEELTMTSPIPSSFCRDLMLWMCIAWVLRLPYEFTQTTNIAIMRREGQELSALGLPLTRCISKIEQVCSEVTEAIVAQLHGLLEEYSDPNYQCPDDGPSFECGSILYGALIREMRLAGLLVSDFVPSVRDMDLSEILNKMQSFRSPEWCYPGRYKSRFQHSCSLKARVAEIVNSSIHPGKGLDLEDFGRI
ncbi:hypothetical protein DM02DRAFT_674890 [Periconia macrospinosa]|uniref:BTB domain-containing protein n=1 Tax=Periconia macrospinosa TaxID=97972 RepID=A0A2V1DDZ8_9PLEO|nr:hypothetical protein DM02DRAFT_674890 [Periconia macrospinosa]